MSDELKNDVPADDAAVYVISVAAEISGLHPQTLRQYDKLGLVSPSRTEGVIAVTRCAILHYCAQCKNLLVKESITQELSASLNLNQLWQIWQLKLLSCVLKLMRSLKQILLKDLHVAAAVKLLSISRRSN